MVSLWIRVIGTAPRDEVLPGLGTTDEPALVIEAGYAPTDSETVRLAESEQLIPLDDFVPSTSLTEALDFQPYRTKRQLRADSLWKAGADITMYRDALHEAHFSFSVQPDLAGQQIWFRVTYTLPDSHTIPGTQSGVLLVEAPCSIKDSARILASHICVSAERQQYDRAIALGDSMMQRGWSDLTGLVFAGTAAFAAKRFDKAIQLLDYMFSATGQVDDMYPESPQDPAVVRQEYERLRQLMLQRQAEQQER